MPALEYRNKTWSWLDFLNQLKKDAIRAIIANTASLLKEKIFVRSKVETIENSEDNTSPAFTPSLQIPVSVILGVNSGSTPKTKISKSNDRLSLQRAFKSEPGDRKLGEKLIGFFKKKQSSLGNAAVEGATDHARESLTVGSLYDDDLGDLPSVRLTDEDKRGRSSGRSTPVRNSRSASRN